MAHSLIHTAPDFSDPLGLLTACHGRIEAQCSTLLRLVSHLRTHGADEQARQAAQKALKYFNSAGRYHHEDEERNLFPLLQESTIASPEIAALTDELALQHRQMEAAWATLAPVLQEIAAGHVPNCSVGEVIEPFVSLYRNHMAREETYLLPYARSNLRPDQLEILGRSMAARRER